MSRDKKSSQGGVELPETSRLEQLKLLLDEYIFGIIAFGDKWYGKIARLCNKLFDMLPFSESRREALKGLSKKLALIFGIIFLVFFVFVWLNPFLGFLVIILLASAIFYWPDLAFRYREYMEHKGADSAKG